MRVFQIQDDWGFDNLKMAERPDPKPGRGQVLIRMHMASLNARDLIVPERGYGRATGNLPLIPVSDGVGVVVETGEGVTRVAAGDRVCPTYFQNWIGGAPTKEAFASALGGPLDGVAAELVCLSEEGVVRIPEDLSDAEAATLPCAGLTAWSAITTLGRVRPGDRVLVQGTGGVALFALAFAKMQGAHVTVISSSDEKLEATRAMGADTAINYRETPDWAKASREITADRGGFDLIVELGGAKTLPLSLRAIRPGGTIAMIGVLSGLQLDASLGPIVARQVRLQGVTVGHRDGFEAMLCAMSLHGTRPFLGRTFAFEGLRDALEHLRAGPGMGKTLIEF
ncbi:NAD(P)-dependent alcohol dehydrogenase [Paracoccus sp. 1_MG-2023]|uniref:zinc-dependent alcohol dehydrogenase family protein n=1 Tax=unclassified Paracoccus (in: a-proteobacteria) TaxID=2688777 RepID=UPI001C0A0BD8|nr:MULTISPECIES: NAD(P)-dependent alcohol dehydrogenase [unclassified Paracoccus (in: a-proteobacteria)]MBU2959105.1 NAD(P)-dependent alcohol dehydrogenase [Paracoccus sp. C2R09]MDO6669389.1 NAD(P)-dependent alcohol dehydrogenase [Paracoccus sp. 1_MG-2023]